jgi:hypothetical protein
MTAKHGLWRYYQGHRYILALTPLNERMDRAYARCLSNGGHKPSGQTVSRDFGTRQLSLPICARCACPYNFPKITSAQSRWNGVAVSVAIGE